MTKDSSGAPGDVFHCEMKVSRILAGRLEYGSDLLESLTALCVSEKIRAGKIEALGAVSRAAFLFYDQSGKAYVEKRMDEPMEILCLSGNVSLKDGNPFVHAHITLGKENGQTTGGHLAVGTQVFACEYVVTAWDGPDFVRSPDEKTGLFLWKRP